MSTRANATVRYSSLHCAGIDHCTLVCTALTSAPRMLHPHSANQREHRGMAWKLMLGYLPANESRRQHVIQRKRAEYRDTIAQHYDIDADTRSLQEQETLRQVLVDVPRTAPEVPLFRNEKIRRSLGRMLYIWAMRHPASSYVQGINDLATPLYAVFLGDLYDGEDVLDGNIMVVLPDEKLDEVCTRRHLHGLAFHGMA
mmetsp:Transcript_7206/g.19529  ORF Transcript_7206/g.19529 Transcript_7206/m.19529 type:complete len:199 (-) Transcript_7206:1074-1670(-)